MIALEWAALEVKLQQEWADGAESVSVAEVSEFAGAADKVVSQEILVEYHRPQAPSSSKACGSN